MNDDIMFPILLGRLERPVRNEDDERMRQNDQRDLVRIVNNAKSPLRNDGEIDALARVLCPRVG